MEVGDQRIHYTEFLTRVDEDVRLALEWHQGATATGAFQRSDRGGSNGNDATAALPTPRHRINQNTVSYTHLTLPTKRIV